MTIFEVWKSCSFCPSTQLNGVSKHCLRCGKTLPPNPIVAEVQMPSDYRNTKAKRPCLRCSRVVETTKENRLCLYCNTYLSDYRAHADAMTLNTTAMKKRHENYE